MIPLNEISKKVSYYKKDDGSVFFVKEEDNVFRYIRVNNTTSRDEVTEIFKNSSIKEGKYSPFFSPKNNKLESMMMQTKDLFGSKYDFSIIQRMSLDDFKRQIVNISSLEKQIPRTVYNQDGISLDMIRSYNFMSFLITYELSPYFIGGNMTFALNYRNHICFQKDISLLYAIFNNFDKHQLSLFFVIISAYKEKKRMLSTISESQFSDYSSFHKTQIL